jgi:hypothetical protein
MKAETLSFHDQSRSQKCMAGVTLRNELSRRTQKILNSNTTVKRYQGISKRQGSDSERYTELRYCVQNLPLRTLVSVDGFFTNFRINQSW